MTQQMMKTLLLILSISWVMVNYFIFENFLKHTFWQCFGSVLICHGSGSGPISENGSRYQIPDPDPDPVVNINFFPPNKIVIFLLFYLNKILKNPFVCGNCFFLSSEVFKKYVEILPSGHPILTGRPLRYPH